MAATCAPAVSANRVLDKILAKLGRSSIGDLKQHLFIASAAPTASTTGMVSGDLVYDTANDDVYYFAGTTSFTKVFD